jgi:hypothetical protein
LIACMEAAWAYSSSMLAIFGRGTRASVPGRAREPRRDRVDRDAVRPKLAGQRPRDTDDAGLARHVVYGPTHH